MRYAIFSDIHGNWQAWNAILADMYDSNVDEPVCLGDIVGYGPCPQKVLDGIREVTTNFVMGNHDAAASGVIDPQMFNDTARAVIEWTRDQLNEDAVEFLRDMALVIEDGDLLFVHAEIEEPGRFYYIDSEEEAQENFKYCTQRVTFVGHTHDPAIFVENEDGTATRIEDVDCTLQPDRRYIINVGSVGEPRNPEDIRARYVIFDTETNEVSFRRIEFDIDGYRADLEASGLSIKPYFLTVVDSYSEAVELAETTQGKLMRDMRTPVHAPKLLSKGSRRVVVSSHSGRPPLQRKPPPVQKTGPGAGLIMTIFTILLIGVCGALYWVKAKQDNERVVKIGEEKSSSGSEEAPSMSSLIQTELGGGATVAPRSLPPVPDRSPDGEQLNDWNFDNPDGAVGTYQFEIFKAGKKVEPLIKKVPKNGNKNYAATKGGIWHSPKPNELYALRSDRSWTFEGWFKTGPVEGEKTHQIIAGDRSREDIGWRLDIRNQSGQKLNFSYAPVQENENNRYFRVPAESFFDDKPHHFAVVWDHNAVAGETGTITVFVDGRPQEGVTSDSKPDQKAPRLGIPVSLVSNVRMINPFAIGGQLKSEAPLEFEGELDELRFTAGTKKPQDFLVATADGKLPAPPAKAPVKPAETEQAKKMAAKEPAPKPPEPKPVEATETLPSFLNGLIFYAPLDEPPGSKAALDLSGNGRHLGIGALKTGEEGQVGATVHFSKKGAVSKSIPFGGATNLTMAFWILLDAEKPGKASNVINMPGYAVVRIDKEQIQINLSKKRGLTGIKFAPDGKWHHFVIENDTKKTRVYRDGVKIQEFAGDSSKRPKPESLAIQLGTGDSRFKLDEAAVWRRLLSAEEKVALYQIGKAGIKMKDAPEVISYWKFDEEGGRLYEDSFGNFKLGGDVRARREEPIAPGQIPLTREQNAGAFRAQMLFMAPEADPAPFALTKKEGFTYEGWFHPHKSKLAYLGRTNGRRDDAVGWFFALARETGKNGSAVFRFGDGADNQALADNLEIYDGKPHHFAAVWNPQSKTEGVGTLEVFVDGVSVASHGLAHSDVIEGNSDPLQIGGERNDLIVDEIRFTRAALRPMDFLTAGVVEVPAPPEEAGKK